VTGLRWRHCGRGDILSGLDEWSQYPGTLRMGRSHLQMTARLCILDRALNSSDAHMSQLGEMEIAGVRGPRFRI
jgi:hypothetical protein